MKKSGSLVGGAVLGTVFNALYEGLKHLIHKNHIFKAFFKDMKSSLDHLRPLIQQIVECNDKLIYCSKEELEGLEEVIKEGGQLVEKCLKVSRWKHLKKYKYARKLLEWDESLKMQLVILKVQESRDVKKIAVELDNLAIKVDHMNDMIQNQSAGSSSSHAALELPPLPDLIVGLEVPLMELKRKLLTDDGESMLVLTAPGGCGKTTLAKKFCQDQQVKEQVGRWLQRYFVEKRHHPILLVLDDVWSGSESIVGHFHFEMSNYKILVTSRSEFPWFASSYHLKLLDEHNAMKLFHHYASLGDGSSLIKEELSRKIVQRCNGFPLAITIVGRSLCEKPIEFWRKTEAEWAKGSSILDTETKLFLCLQSSLDALDEDMALVKECFFDLGSFPEDYQIPLATLFDMWVELHGLDEHSKCIANVYELRTRTLANLIDHREMKMEGDDFYDERFLTQHDLLRELAIYHAKLEPVERRKRVIIEICGNDLPKWWRERKYQPMKARLLSISTDRGSQWNGPTCKCQK
ncbi:putative powdery mildew resistance protein, RPW8 [Rosa chinensis]|uniref:Putative powdery mildew resistance protein, RPW8 n=1 Tax=Rosa chinensis TaxID=74649 RepID=A0A2P6RC05_ROSCH|nr:putative powdery mildew resistance protein, RPW8 [Rosa chinensis]